MATAATTWPASSLWSREPEHSRPCAPAMLSLRFLQGALDSDGRCRNRMDRFGVGGLAGVNDSWGRTIWGLGTAASQSETTSFGIWLLAASSEQCRSVPRGPGLWHSQPWGPRAAGVDPAEPDPRPPLRRGRRDEKRPDGPDGHGRSNA